MSAAMLLTKFLAWHFCLSSASRERPFVDEGMVFDLGVCAMQLFGA